jgi:hypothetical protein
MSDGIAVRPSALASSVSHGTGAWHVAARAGSVAAMSPITLTKASTTLGSYADPRRSTIICTAWSLETAGR